MPRYTSNPTYNRTQPKRGTPITEREGRVLTLLADGRSEAAAAAVMGLHHTSVSRLANIARLKLGAATLIEAVVKWREKRS